MLCISKHHLQFESKNETRKMRKVEEGEGERKVEEGEEKKKEGERRGRRMSTSSLFWKISVVTDVGHHCVFIYFWMNHLLRKNHLHFYQCFFDSFCRVKENTLGTPS
jgi:hypothetical protein